MYALIGLPGISRKKTKVARDGGPQSEDVKGKSPDDVRRHRMAGHVAPDALLLQDLGARFRVPQVRGGVPLNDGDGHA